jgi:hypothetical protein
MLDPIVRESLVSSPVLSALARETIAVIERREAVERNRRGHH